MFLHDESKQELMVQKMTGTGLCGNCSQVESCRLQSENSEPVWFCEEFICESSRIVTNYELPGKRDNGSSVSIPENARGLCQNCSVFASCTFEKSEGGVWHCNEYV